MNKQAFLAALQEQLKGLSQNDMEKSLEYYSEIIDDQIEDGIPEEEAVSAMGAPEEIARQILMDLPLPKVVRVKTKPSRPLRVWEIVLLVLGSPVWVPLMLTAVILFAVCYMVIWVMIFALYAIDFSFAMGALAGFIQGGISLFTLGGTQAAFYFGTGLVSIGVAILLFFAFNILAVKLVHLSQQFILWTKSCFLRKGDNK
ncbi:MAG TPA: DUF1700 domain-containing protein [Candidatus Gallacutalibacter pullistercoris]|nr:DUF1700 domain-containing protein [Candidatus Gallacutalibacter pullistercoris]